MNAHRATDPRSPSVVDLTARRAGIVAPYVSVRLRRSGRWTIVEVEGEMNLQVPALVPDLLGINAMHVVFELRRVTFLDACGIGMMVESQRRAREAGGCVRLVAPSRRVRKLLMLTGTDRVFLVFDSLGEAVSTPVDAGPQPAS
jgi:anti-sigma B factor antagonist